jgi:hypothetical protein
MFGKLSLKTLCVAGVLAVAMTTAQSAVFLASAGGGGTGQNLIFNGCASPTGSGTSMLSGCINGNQSLLVNVTGTENLVIAGGGQAKIEGQDGSLTYLKIDPTNFLSSKMIVNIDASADGFVTFNDALGASQTLAVDGKGNNFFTLTGGDLNFITLSASTGINFSQVEQVRFESTVISAIPEPQEWAMLVGGLAVVSAIAKRRKTKGSKLL